MSDTGVALTVAIIVPCYNAASTLVATLTSALGQAGVFEIVAINDGSSDDTLAVARKFEPMVRVLTGPNRGVSAARNLGIAATTAEWIIFLDSDDLLMPGTVAQRLDVARKVPVDVIVTDWVDLVDDGKGTVSTGPRRGIDWQAMSSSPDIATATHVWATTAALMYRRPLIERIGGFRPDLPVIQDARLLFDAALHGARFAHAAHVGAQYRVLSSSLSRRNPSHFWLDVLLNAKQMEAAWRDRDCLDAQRKRAISDCYSVAARGLLGVAHPAFFDAVEAQAKLGLAAPRLNQIAAPVARFFGLGIARRLLHFTARV